VSKTPKAAKVNWRKSCEDALNQVHALAKVVQERTEFGNRFHARALQADEALKTELLTTAVLREEVKNLSAKIVKMQAENYQQVLDYNKLWNSRNAEVETLELDLAHSDEHRRMLERDIREQQDELAILKPFNRILRAIPPKEPRA